MSRTLDADYLVVGAGAMGMAFTDALVDHAPDVRVVLVDRRRGAGGHWLNAYPFVRLHQASSLYGVASTRLGSGKVQVEGPEAGLHERADQGSICDYYDDVLKRLVGTGRVDFLPGTDFLGGRTVESLETGLRFEVPHRCRVVDARYLAPDIPAEMPPRFAVSDGAHVVPPNVLMGAQHAHSQYVVTGSGKTATDTVIWLLQQGVDPDAICWVRPREPWMFNRAVIQPDPVVFLGMVATLMQAAGEARTLPDLFTRLEEAGVMLRIDPSAETTMAKAPTLARWELDLLRSVENVVRLGHVRAVDHGRIHLAEGSVPVADDALVVNCAGDGLKTPPLVPIWQPEAITPQPVRSGFPCFGAALVGFVEASGRDDEEKNHLCRPSTYGNSMAQWAMMSLQGARNTVLFRSAPDVREWSDDLLLNPTRVPPSYADAAALGEVLEQVQRHGEAGVAGLARLVGTDAEDAAHLG